MLDRLYAEVPRFDLTERFRFLVRQIFHVFDAGSAERPGAWDIPNWANLDASLHIETPCPEPFRLAVEAESRSGRFSLYRTPEPLGCVSDAIRHYLLHAGLVSETASAGLDVALGPGSVHLYDVLCRFLVEVPGDAIVVPDFSYGFFLPQIGMAGGDAIAVPVDAGGRVAADTLVGVIAGTDRHKLERWRRHAGHAIMAALDGVVQPAQALVRAVERSVASISAGMPRAEILEAIAAPLRDHCPESELAARLARVVPPRCVALLHANPSMTGALYRQEDIESLVPAIEQAGLAVIEDLAHHWYTDDLADLHSFLGTRCRTYTLLGVSKTFGIAEWRLGVLVARASILRPFYPMIEASCGFVATPLQVALARLMGQGADFHRGYRRKQEVVTGTVWRKRALMRACVEGADRHGSGQEIRSMLEGIADELRPAVTEFCSRGLQWAMSFRFPPDAGFFAVVDCEAALRMMRARGLPARGAFDLFAYLSYFHGIRTIPEQAMTPEWRPEGTHLRLSYAAAPEQVALACFATFVALRAIEAMSMGGRR
ncbi:aminotransferase class I/II-fold pyridoxal phosphate-dependent enzyme [Nonomuraea sp. NPDC050786]|uniref:aminotransferase class I/II-fold pyridoxal phosphate-dependent enzyme n=1 Tax=Nonomuraea sp. NPDC050786 TaxID=3154840 RepID=UPI0033CDDC75